MYTSINFKSKAEVKRALAAGQVVTVFQRNGDLHGTSAPTDGRVALKGPHFPQPHRWYAEGTMQNGRLVSVK